MNGYLLAERCNFFFIFKFRAKVDVETHFTYFGIMTCQCIKTKQCKKWSRSSYERISTCLGLICLCNILLISPKVRLCINSSIVKPHLFRC